MSKSIRQAGQTRKRNGKWEVFDARDGAVITHARTARDASKTASALDQLRGSMHDYARRGDGWGVQGKAGTLKP